MKTHRYIALKANKKGEDRKINLPVHIGKKPLCSYAMPLGILNHLLANKNLCTYVVKKNWQVVKTLLHKQRSLNMMKQINV